MCYLIIKIFNSVSKIYFEFVPHLLNFILLVLNIIDHRTLNIIINLNISPGVGALVLLIIIAVLACKLRKRCKKSDQRRISETNSHIQYSGLNRTENKL